MLLISQAFQDKSHSHACAQTFEYDCVRANKKTHCDAQEHWPVSNPPGPLSETVAG